MDWLWILAKLWFTFTATVFLSISQKGMLNVGTLLHFQLASSPPLVKMGWNYFYLPLSCASLILRLSFIALPRTEHWYSRVSCFMHVYLPLSCASLILRLSFIALPRTEYWCSSLPHFYRYFFRDNTHQMGKLANSPPLIMGQLKIETLLHSLAQNWILMLKCLYSTFKFLGVLHHPLQIAKISLKARCLLVLLVQVRHLLQHVGGQEEWDDQRCWH